MNPQLEVSGSLPGETLRAQRLPCTRPGTALGIGTQGCIPKRLPGRPDEALGGGNQGPRVLLHSLLKPEAYLPPVGKHQCQPIGLLRQQCSDAAPLSSGLAPTWEKNTQQALVAAQHSTPGAG